MNYDESVHFWRFKERQSPFRHWVAKGFVDASIVAEINKEWPAYEDERWFHEGRDYVRKSSMMFPKRLPKSANSLAEEMYSEERLKQLSEMVGIELLPDPWFTDGPPMPRVGGGLHEIGPGGFLGIHIDFTIHPTGLARCLNLLIYLNEDWDTAWGGDLELQSPKGDVVTKIPPHAGTAVVFPTHAYSWHGHPHPLNCPKHRARRSLALYYYTRPKTPPDRKTTVYR